MLQFVVKGMVDVAEHDETRIWVGMGCEGGGP